MEEAKTLSFADADTLEGQLKARNSTHLSDVRKASLFAMAGGLTERGQVKGARHACLSGGTPEWPCRVIHGQTVEAWRSDIWARGGRA